MDVYGIRNNVEESCVKWTVPNHTTKDFVTHSESCKNSKENGIVFEELRKMNQKYETLNAAMSEMQKKEEKIKTEVMEEIKSEILNAKNEVRKEMEIYKTEFQKEISNLKANFKKDLETEIDLMLKKGKRTSDAALPTLFRKVNVLEEGMKEKMAEVHESISTVVHSILDVKGQEVTSSSDNNNGLERLADQVAQLNNKTDTFSAQLESNGRDLQVVKGQMEAEVSKQLVEKMKGFHQEPSQFDQLIFPMNCFNLVTHNYLFQPSFRWTIDGIKAKISQKTFEVSSEMFQWNGYPVQARAKLELRENGWIHLSLCLNEALENEAIKDIKPIPCVLYLIKDKYARNPRHICEIMSYFTGTVFRSSLPFVTEFGYKNWFKRSPFYDDDADSVEIEIYVEPPRMARLVHSYDGTLDWAIGNYKKKLRLAKSEQVLFEESPYFYTGPKGYRVQATMYLNGEKKGSEHLNVRVAFVSGVFDADLPKAFPYAVTVTLIDRKEAGKSVVKTVEQDIVERKCCSADMCELEQVEKFIENDTLFCKVSVQSL